MSASLVGSEMCIRDSGRAFGAADRRTLEVSALGACTTPSTRPLGHWSSCLLYTSDAADDM
eukprot:15129765-Alexandrium_andersonii.AAC.1